MSVATALAAMTLYATGFALLWRHRQFHTALTEPMDTPAASNQPPTLLVLLALFFHGGALYSVLSTAEGVVLSVPAVSSIVAWVMVAVVAVANVRAPVSNLYFFLFPLSIATIALGQWLTVAGTPMTNVSAPLLAHILLSLAAYSTLMMAACQSILLTVQERRLRTPGKSALRVLPPLETMEHLLVTMLWCGLILLTGAIATGFVFLDDMFAQHVVHHTVLTSLSWLVYALFIAGHYVFGWRGLTTVRWTLVAFTLLVLGYLGSKFVLDYLIER